MKRLAFLLPCIFVCLCFHATDVSGQEIKTISGGVLNGKAVKLVKPVYPPAARAVDAGGLVNVMITVDKEGDVISAESVSGHPLLRSAAEKAARESEFSPSKLSGKPVKVTGILIFNFSSQKETNLPVEKSEETEEEAVNALAVNLPSPEYPPAARAVNAGGKVRVQIIIDKAGNVSSATAISGHPLLRQAADKAAKLAKFDPAKLDEKYIGKESVLIYVFFPLPPEKEN